MSIRCFNILWPLVLSPKFIEGSKDERVINTTLENIYDNIIFMSFNRDGSFLNAAFDVVVVAASLGGHKALGQILSALPPYFPSAIVVAQHRPSGSLNLMAQLLSRQTGLIVKQAKEGNRLHPGTVYITPAGHHALINPNHTLSLSRSEKVLFVRPSANVLFESAAASCKDRVIGVILTGTGSDGAKGVQAIKKMGGRVLVQNKATCASFDMPGAAISTGCVDFVLPLDKIAAALIALVMVRGAATLFEVPIPSWAYLTE